MRFHRFVATTALFIGAVTESAFAHHAFSAEFDIDKPVELKGTLTKVKWTNPHSWVYLDVKDEKGATKSYKVEMGPPYALTRGGWTRDILKAGDKITINNAAAAKDGTNAAGSMPETSMTLSSGKKLVMR